MRISLNGDDRELSGPMTVACLLTELGLAERRVAVQINREIVPRSRHDDHMVQNNDRVDVVRAIGGG